MSNESSKVTIEPVSFKKYAQEYYPGGLRKSPNTKDQMQIPSYGILATLIICFLLLKKLIYIKDEKRHGK